MELLIAFCFILILMIIYLMFSNASKDRIIKSGNDVIKSGDALINIYKKQEIAYKDYNNFLLKESKHLLEIIPYYDSFNDIHKFLMENESIDLYMFLDITKENIAKYENKKESENEQVDAEVD